ncbi:MAG: hypothetical protein QM708_01535 [Propioniciclava sp.]|uniref:hypothetical protein n=1 Tax=Propioniciclava sp. TaxID=2038686 RepID=UPI0039E5291F
MSDLADRISRAAVAALDLAPFDDRYGRLSRQVLAGGASRFKQVITDDQAVHYVIPVGLVGERVAYGALVLQERQAGVLWRDADGLDHTALVPRDETLSARYAPVLLGAEEWMRFDVTAASARLAFLAPPVTGPLLDRALIDFFRAEPGAPVIMDDRVLTSDDTDTTAIQPAVEPEPEPDDVGGHHDSDATSFYDPYADDAPDHRAEPTAPVAAAPSVPEPAPATPVVTPAQVPPRASALSSQDTVPSQTTVPLPPVAPPAPFDIYRDEAPSAPGATAAMPAAPAPAVRMPVAPAPVAAAPAVVTPVAKPGMSRTTAGFLIGFFGVLVVAGAAFALRLIGG